MEYVEIPMDVYLGLLEDRLEVCAARGWAGRAQRSLFHQLLELIEDSGIARENADPAYLIDNYCVNGEFIDREDFEKNPELYSSYEDWDDVCDNALFSNDSYACMQF